MDNINEPQFDEVDLNRLYEALRYRITAHRLGIERVAPEELAAILELKDRIGQTLDVLACLALAQRHGPRAE